MVRAVFVRVILVAFCATSVLGCFTGSGPSGGRDAQGMVEIRSDAFREDEAPISVVVISESESRFLTFSRGPGFPGGSVIGVAPLDVTFLPASREVLVEREKGEVDQEDPVSVCGVPDLQDPDGHAQGEEDEEITENIVLVLRIREFEAAKERPERFFLYDVTRDGEVLLGYRGQVILVSPGFINGFYAGTGTSDARKEGSSERSGNVGFQEGSAATRDAPGEALLYDPSAGDVKRLLWGDGPRPYALTVENLGVWRLSGRGVPGSGVAAGHTNADPAGVTGRGRKTRGAVPLIPVRILRHVAKSLAWGEYFRDSLALVRQKTLVVLISERWLGEGLISEGVEREAAKPRDPRPEPSSGQAILVIRELRVAGVPASFETLVLQGRDLPRIFNRLAHTPADHIPGTDERPDAQTLRSDDGLGGPGVMLLREAVASHVKVRFFPVAAGSGVATVRPGQTVRCVWKVDSKARRTGSDPEGQRERGGLDESEMKVILPPASKTGEHNAQKDTEDLKEGLLTSLSKGDGVCAIFVTNLGMFCSGSWGVTGRNDG